jgi:hypothetical protein
MPRVTRFVLLAFLLATSILVTVRLSEYNSYFVQHAGTYVVQLFAILIAYVIAIVFVGQIERNLVRRDFQTRDDLRSRVRSIGDPHDSRRE